MILNREKRVNGILLRTHTSKMTTIRPNEIIWFILLPYNSAIGPTRWVLKKMLKSKEIGEDDEKSKEKIIQTITDDHIKSVDEKVSSKEKEIMTI